MQKEILQLQTGGLTSKAFASAAGVAIGVLAVGAYNGTSPEEVWATMKGAAIGVAAYRTTLGVLPPKKSLP